MRTSSVSAKSLPLLPSDGLLAAIDMGSNSFRLEIAQVHQGRYRRIDYLKETVRLGGGLDAQGMLTEEAMNRGTECLRRFATRLEGFPGSRVRAVATQTLREAQNRNTFLARGEKVLGHPIEVISGREEARLIFAGVARLQPSNVPRLVVDIGGRSTEMILGKNRHPKQAESFQIGSVSLSMKYFPDGALTKTAFRSAQIAAGAELEEALVPFGPTNWREALGSSGTAGAVSQLLLANRITDGRITPAGLQWLISACLDAGHVDKLNLSGLKDDRRAVMPGGLCILYTLAAQFGIHDLQPARGALRQGVIFDLSERLSAAAHPQDAQDIRDTSVRELQSRFDIDTPQADRVMQVAAHLYDGLVPKRRNAKVADESRRELLWAAALHEIGMVVSHHDHHRHSAYVMTHADAPGFSQSQQRRLGMLLLAQRGGLRKVEAELHDETLVRQILCLRLAIIKCHARSEIEPPALRLATRNGALALIYSQAWSLANPRTVYLLQEEVAAWARLQAPGLRLGS
jgi:exopolyphosphatase/guanosine-5'-triphosphate,3'-diphosphate pyrophosphatase